VQVEVLVCSIRHALLGLGTGYQRIILILVEGVGIQGGVKGIVHFLDLVGQSQSGVSVVCCVEASFLHGRDDFRFYIEVYNVWV
jgi:hypothetical protein